MARRVQRPRFIIKPCHVLRWCPYGDLVEQFPLGTPDDPRMCRVCGHICPVYEKAEKIPHLG